MQCLQQIILIKVECTSALLDKGVNRPMDPIKSTKIQSRIPHPCYVCNNIGSHPSSNIRIYYDVIIYSSVFFLFQYDAIKQSFSYDLIISFTYDVIIYLIVFFYNCYHKLSLRCYFCTNYRTGYDFFPVILQ